MAFSKIIIFNIFFNLSIDDFLAFLLFVVNRSKHCCYVVEFIKSNKITTINFYTIRGYFFKSIFSCFF